jgi:hypothetical protein
MAKNDRDLKEWYSQRLTALYLKLVDAQERSPEELKQVIEAEAGEPFEFLPRDSDFVKKDVLH